MGNEYDTWDIANIELQYFTPNKLRVTHKRVHYCRYNYLVKDFIYGCLLFFVCIEKARKNYRPKYSENQHQNLGYQKALVNNDCTKEKSSNQKQYRHTNHYFSFSKIQIFIHITISAKHLLLIKNWELDKHKDRKNHWNYAT
jgi:hypothetical protein